MSAFRPRSRDLCYNTSSKQSCIRVGIWTFCTAVRARTQRFVLASCPLRPYYGTVQFRNHVPDIWWHNPVLSHTWHPMEVATQSQEPLSDRALPVVHSGHTMAQSTSETMYLTYDDIIQSCLTDGIHWKLPLTSTTTIRYSLSEFAIRCPMRHSTLSPYRTVVQKAILDGCFRCASQDHRADSCSVSPLQCTKCKRNDHSSNACRYQWLPRWHCG